MLSRITEVTQNSDGSIIISFLQNDGRIILQNCVTIEKGEVPRFLAAVGLKSVKMIEGMSHCPNHLVDFELETPLSLKIKMKIAAQSISSPTKVKRNEPVPVTSVDGNVISLKRNHEYMLDRKIFERIENAMGTTIKDALSNGEVLMVTVSQITPDNTLIYLPVSINVVCSHRFAVTDKK